MCKKIVHMLEGVKTSYEDEKQYFTNSYADVRGFTKISALCWYSLTSAGEINPRYSIGDIHGKYGITVKRIGIKGKIITWIEELQDKIAVKFDAFF